MLKIGTSKVGSVVNCPRCHKSVVVPPFSTPQAEQLYHILKEKTQAAEHAKEHGKEHVVKHSIATTVPPQPPVEDHTAAEPEHLISEPALEELGSSIDEADLNRWIDELWTDAPKQQQEQELFPMPPPVAAPVAEEIALLALHKRYKLAVTLLYVLTSVAFLVGIVFGIALHGYYTQPTRHHRGAAVVSENEVTGTLYYFNENGERRADVDAVVICLPMDRPGAQLLSCEGLRPDDAVNHDTVRLIHERGGMYERADANGAFTLHYQPGVRYLAILISSHQKSGGGMKPTISQTLRTYFRNPELFGAYSVKIDEYDWDKHSLRHTFESAD
jgi:hypothetical protein